LKPFDERLFQLKLQPINQRMHAEAGKCWPRARAEVKRLGNHARLLPAFVEYELEVLRKYLEEVDRLRREVWLLDGNAVTPEFIRTILAFHAFTIIAARKGAIQHELNRHATRTGEHQRGGHILAHQMNRLQGEVANRYEVGQGNARLFSRLRSHRRDSLAHRWQYFSWFGLLTVNKSGQLSGWDNQSKRVLGTIGSTLNEIEGVLIAATEPPFNKQGAKFRGIPRYRQMPHIDAEHISLSQLREILTGIDRKIDKLRNR
jgi:hypothetical protein